LNKKNILILLGSLGIFLPLTQREDRQKPEENIIENTVQMEGHNSVWTGTIIGSEGSKRKILTIIHENNSRSYGFGPEQEESFVRIDNRRLKATLKKWDPCSELALFEVDSDSKVGKNPAVIGKERPEVAEELMTAGNPIGLGIYFSKGFLSKEETIRKDCGLVASGFTAGVVPGQTGSGVFRSNGELIGVVIAVSAIPISAEGAEQGIVMHVPIYGIGHFVPLNYIESFLK
jgi:S1-C subfamily serine protease